MTSGDLLITCAIMGSVTTALFALRVTVPHRNVATFNVWFIDWISSLVIAPILYFTSMSLCLAYEFFATFTYQNSNLPQVLSLLYKAAFFMAIVATLSLLSSLIILVFRNIWFHMMSRCYALLAKREIERALRWEPHSNEERQNYDEVRELLKRNEKQQ